MRQIFGVTISQPQDKMGNPVLVGVVQFDEQGIK
jgi:hypothetical protein